MIAKKCVHPIKVNREIKNFVNTASGKIFTISSSPQNTMNFFINGSEIMVPRWRTADYNNDIGGKLFRKDFVKRCPMAKGFADVTISLLHEVGHKMTRKNIPYDFCRWEAIQEINAKANSPQELCELYFNLTDEMLATNWAIDWLSNANNRKLAKEFEKKFFACFE